MYVEHVMHNITLKALNVPKYINNFISHLFTIFSFRLSIVSCVYVYDGERNGKKGNQLEGARR